MSYFVDDDETQIDDSSLKQILINNHTVAANKSKIVFLTINRVFMLKISTGTYFWFL